MKTTFLTMVLTCAMSVTYAQSKYDLNGDGKENVEDMTYLANHLLGKDITTSPVATVSGKSNNYWYVKNTNQTGGSDDIHGNVSLPTDNTTLDLFTVNVASTFIGGKPQLTGLSDAYSDLANNAVISYLFATPDVTTVSGNDGKTYTLSVSEDGTQLTATNGGSSTVVATIVPSTGIITLAQNDVAKALLNHAGSDALGDGETFTAKVSIEATCDPIGKITLNDNTFNVKFLRPINLVNACSTTWDADNNGDGLPFLDVLKLYDWRGPVGGDMETNKWFYGYYDVKSVKFNVNSDNVYTTMHKTTVDDSFDPVANFPASYWKLSQASSLVNLYAANHYDAATDTYTIDPASPKSHTGHFDFTPYANHASNQIAKAYATNHIDDFGYIYFTNDEWNVKDFYIAVPVEIGYKLGQINEYVFIRIHPTMSNNN